MKLEVGESYISYSENSLAFFKVLDETKFFEGVKYNVHYYYSYFLLNVYFDDPGHLWSHAPILEDTYIVKEFSQKHQVIEKIFNTSL